MGPRQEPCSFLEAQNSCTMINMNRLRTKMCQIVYRLKRDYLTLNNVILVVALILCASWAWASIITMTRNWELEQKLITKQLAKDKLGLEIATMQLEQEYYLTAEYQELIARAKQNKMLDGETMIVLPKNSETAKNKFTEDNTIIVQETSNFDSWVNFLFPKVDK